jgi:hypothetical protein
VPVAPPSITGKYYDPARCDNQTIWFNQKYWLHIGYVNSLMKCTGAMVVFATA